MLFQTLDKLKRQSILAAILMMAFGIVMLICPESYVNTLVVTVGYGMIVFAIVEMLEFLASKKAMPTDAGGFAPIDCEWWHYALADEPFPDTYFEFPVCAASLAR